MKTFINYLAFSLLMLVSASALASGHTVSITVDQHASCFGLTDGQATAVVNGGTGPFTYLWDDGAGTTSDILAGIGAGTYNVTVTDESDGSTATASCIITEPAQVSVVATSNGPICSGNSLMLDASTIAGASYLWTGPNSYSSTTQSSVIPNAATNLSGVYSVVATVGGCSSAPATTVVQVFATPVTPTVTSNSPVCSGSSIVLGCPTAYSMATYSWSGPGAMSFVTQNPTVPSASMSDGGVYQLYVTVNGCPSAPGSTNVVVNSTPAVPSPTSNSPVCEGQVINLIHPNVAGATFTWTYPDGTVVVGQSPTILVATPNSSGNYSLRITQNGCISPAGFTSVMVNMAPIVSAGTDITSCDGNAVTLQGSFSGGASSVTWTTNGLGVFNNASLSSATYTPGSGDIASGSNVLTITTNNPPGPCPAAVDQMTITYAGLANATFSYSPTTYCQSGTDPSPIFPSGSSAGTFTSTSGLVINASTGMIDISASTPGTYTVTNTIPGSGPCPSATATATVTVIATPAAPTPSSNSPVCEGESLFLTTPSVAGGNFVWNGPNGSTSFTQNPTLATMSSATEGTYTVTVTVNGCSSAPATTLVDMVEAPSFVSSTETCDGTNTTYTVSVVLSGTGPFLFTENAPGGIGGSFSGNTWTSNAIPSGTAYDFDFSDMAGLCSVVNVSGSRNCACPTEAGTMNLTPVSTCAGGSGSAIHNSDESLDAGDVLSYVLHTGSSGTLGTVLGHASNPGFNFNSPMVYGTTYYISAVAGNDDGTGLTDLTDPCLSVSIGTPVTWYQYPNAVVTSNSPVCAGDVILLSSTAIPGATYMWTGPNGFTSSNANPVINATTMSSGSYMLTVSDHGCVSAATSTFVNVTSPTTPTFTPMGPYCAGASIPFPPTTSNNGITGTWSPAVNNTATTTYIFTPNPGQCAMTTVLTITINPPAIPTFNPITPFCAGAAAPTLPSTSTNAFTGTWSPAVIDNMNSGTYVFVPAASQCATTAALTVTVNGAPTITAPSVSTCPGVPVVLTASGGMSYTWSPAADLSATTGATVTANPSTTTVYTVTGTDANGCTGSTNVTVTVSGSLTITLSPPIATICAGQSVLLTATGATDYTWTPSVGLATTTSPMVSASPPVTMTYTVTGTTSGCTGSTNVTVTVNPIPVATAIATDATCASSCDGTVSFQSSPSGATFSWSGPSSSGNGTTITDACTGTYTTTPTLAGCAGTPATAIVNAPAGISLTVNPTPPSTCTSCDGIITSSVSGGSAPYSYAWSGPSGFTSTLDNLNEACPGAYTVIVTDNNGCSATNTLQLDNDALDVTVTAGADNCGAGSGSASVAVTGATGNINYHWTPGDMTTQSIFGLTSGTYNVTVLDAAGCTESGSVTIINNNGPTLVTASSPANCGSTDGVINVSASSGVAPYQYSINGTTYGTSGVFTGLAQGTYVVYAKDANNCIGTKEVAVGNSTNLNVTYSTTPATCYGVSNGTVNLNINNGVAPFTFLWNNGATTQNLTNVAPGSYSCNVHDASGCQRTVYMYVSYNNYFYVSSGYTTFDNCGTADVSAQVNNYYGSPSSYTYLWSNGATTQTIYDVPPGTYTVTVTNSAGCSRTGTYTVLNQDYGYIKGKLYVDGNSNCTYDSGDQTMSGTVTATGPSGATYTGYAYYNGDYSIPVPNETGNFTINVTPYAMYSPAYYSLTCAPGTVSMTSNCQTITGVNIGYTTTPAQDLSITGYCGVARPGFQQFSSVTYSNPGTIPMNGTVKVDLDPLLSFNGATPTPSLVSGHHLEWNFSNLQPTQQGYINIYTTVPTIPNGGTLGTPIDMYATVEPLTGDLTPSNNSYGCSTPIVGSYDPNVKEVYSPQAHSSGAIDSSGAELYYTVHFQNTGTDTAFTIVVRDTLSEYVDLTTLEMLSSSHHYTWSLLPGRCLEVRFDQILLVDSNRNEPLSHGYFNYHINTVQDLPLGATIDNTAGIYFDFNDPVITNTVSSPIVAFANVEEKTALEALVYPNPNNTGSVRVKLNGKSYNEIQFQLTDANGRTVRDNSFGNTAMFDVDLSDLQNGIYFYTIVNESGDRSTGKLIITK